MTSTIQEQQSTSSIQSPDNYTASSTRYDTMSYRRCGRSGLQLPPLSLGFWQHAHNLPLVRELCCYGFDHGITHFDLANNYGPPPGIAESHVGHVLNNDLTSHRDELIISTKAGYDMWPGPYGNFASRKYLIASIDQSLQRLGLEYVDIFYHHRPDKNTPLEETIGALADIVRQGKALYVGISNYFGDQITQAAQIAKDLQVPLIINQVKYSMLARKAEREAFEQSAAVGQGVIAFSPLEQGLLTNRYLNGIPEDSRAAKGINRLAERLNPEFISKINSLNELALSRGQDLAQLALAWVLRHQEVCSVIIGASRIEQVAHNLDGLSQLTFSEDELQHINAVLDQ